MIILWLIKAALNNYLTSQIQTNLHMYITTCIQPQILANQSLFNNAFLIEMTKIASVDQ